MIRAVSGPCIDMLEWLEGCSLSPYQDIAGVWTIGIGRTKGVTRDMPALSDRLAAIDLLSEDLKEFELGVETLANRDGISLSDNQFGALVSFVYNEGLGALQPPHDVWPSIKTLKLGAPPEKAIAPIRQWNKYTDRATGQKRISAGLVKRRAAEAAFFLSKDWKAAGEAALAEFEAEMR